MNRMDLQLQPHRRNTANVDADEQSDCEFEEDMHEGDMV